MIYRLLILFGLVLVGVAVWLTLTPRHATPLTAQSSGPAGNDQGYAATDASLVETGADGAPLYTLQAHQVQQDPDTDITHLTTVHMTFRDSAGGEWQAHSDTAEVQQDSSKIDLAGAIDVSGMLGENPQPAHILTDQLHIDTQTQVIRTRSPGVTLKWAGLVVQARSLVVNAKDHDVKLEGGVHGQFAP